MSEARPINLELREYCSVLITIRHCFKLRLFEVRSEVNSGLCINVNQQKLIGQMILKVCEMDDVSSYFCEVPNCDQMISAQTVRFEENLFFLEPIQEMSICALEFDVANAAIAHHMAANADM